ncbi:MAG TPA: PEP-utilizing enzyme, partial [Acidimicrobiales bacterium]|nr:PEP-utilizing enzyme [Acidimicrobiales bacterium]
ESAVPSYAMWKLSRVEPDSDEFKVAFADFLHEYGARGPNEWESSCPTWETDPDLALVAIGQMRRSPDACAPVVHQAARAEERERVGAEITAMLDGDRETQGQFAAALHAATIFLPGRERSKTNAIRLTHEVRLAMRELGRRYVEERLFDEPTAYGMVRWDELDALVDDPSSLARAIRTRTRDYRDLATVEPPFVFEGSPPPVSSWPARGGRPVPVANGGESLHGLPGCPGVARGRARVVLDPHDPTALKPGDVLVAPITDPSWTPLFVPAAGVVVDVGAPLSHAIIVCRELGIPCVVSVTDATRRIPNGAMVEVDGDTGSVSIIST